MKILAILVLALGWNAHGAVQLKDVGIIGLASHDIFAWDHKAEVNTEDGRLNLSTIFDYEGGARWKKGGNPKNGENAPVYSITMRLVDFYKEKVKTHGDEKVARQETVELFRSWIKESYERMSGGVFPTVCVDEKVTNTEQAALRAMHDILPGRVKLVRKALPFKELKLTNALTAKFKLNDKELAQELKYFDGDYDAEYKNIKIPFTKVVINLKEVDRKFIEKFSPYKQADMLSELAKVGAGELNIQDVSFVSHLEVLFSKAICR